MREALALLGLFLSQFVLGGVLPDDLREVERIGIGILYLVLAAGIVVRQRRASGRFCATGSARPCWCSTGGDEPAPEPVP